MKALLTHSRMSAARACMRLHHYKYELGFRPVEDVEELRFGTLIHMALEAWWKAPPSERLAAALAALATEQDVDRFDAIKADCLMRGYDARWGDARYEVLAVEVEFNTELRNPATGKPSRVWRLAGKLDGLVRDLDSGRTVLMEHKTARGDIGPGSEYMKRLRIDGQVSTYYDGAASLGFPPDECLYDVLGKPDIRPLRATSLESRKYTKERKLYANQREHDESPDEYRLRLLESIASDPTGYYQRASIVRLEAELDEARFDVWQTAQQIREANIAHRAPRNPGACSQYGRTCDYFEVCTGEASLEDPLKFRRSENLHPELAGEAAVAELPKEEAAP